MTADRLKVVTVKVLITLQITVRWQDSSPLAWGTGLGRKIYMSSFQGQQRHADTSTLGFTTQMGWFILHSDVLSSDLASMSWNWSFFLSQLTLKKTRFKLFLKVWVSERESSNSTESPNLLHIPPSCLISPWNINDIKYFVQHYLVLEWATLLKECMKKNMFQGPEKGLWEEEEN